MKIHNNTSDKVQYRGWGNGCKKKDNKVNNNINQYYNDEH